MIVTDEQEKELNEKEEDRALLTSINYWPHNGEVVNIPYVVTEYSDPNLNFTKSERAHLARAFEEFKNKTCIRYESFLMFEMVE